ncbi:hypothetical protein K490DRAFT_67738 [Saccharata proteae CBS 121410]|uniref:Calponin-homology (CH) domain-containing protein n=1 Tax=Saccharata proteae CBS 121410 TaxID=1314787 RepID=A0A9P4LT89_9PEZI|nr:hypothetical protein K490DRAFT_67738 [Saccharata proteae CBS 121410]
MYSYIQANPCGAQLAQPPNCLHHHSANIQHAYVNATTSQEAASTVNTSHTIEPGANIQNARPRKRPTEQRKLDDWNPATDIWADDEHSQARQQPIKPASHSASSKIGGKQQTGARGDSRLAQPAQRMKPARLPQREPDGARPRRRRVSAILAANKLDMTSKEKYSMQTLGEDTTTVKKDPRRRTIYVPSDDTTIVTIHPGASTNQCRRENSPDLGFDLVTMSEEDTTDLTPAIKKKAATRKSIASAPKRGPLQQNTRVHQGVSFTEDIVGRGDGKENVPPGWNLGRKGTGVSLKAKEEKTAMQNQSEKLSTQSLRLGTKSPLKNVKASIGTETRKRINSEDCHKESPSKALKAKSNVTAAGRSNTRERSKKASLGKIARLCPFEATGSPPQALRRNRTKKATSELKVPMVVLKDLKEHETYPVLSEDLDRPELYEDSWLTYQEVAITELINKIYDSADNQRDISDADGEEANLRKNLLSIYQEPAIPLLHKRLQASLLYGALSIPKDLLYKASRIKDDVGMRRRYIDLFLETYEPNSLRAAAEVVVGRKIPAPLKRSSSFNASSSSPQRRRAERRAIEDFILAFFVRHEDAVRVKTGFGGIASITRSKEPQNDDFGSQAWAWRRTVLRSLMLILLLDIAKTRAAIPQCLFHTSSPHKSSLSVLQGLTDMLLPSLGDLSRPLSHLNYRLHSAQYPLQEYNYHIDNLAVDLRDGVLLTRLVELLLYSSINEREDLMITMPTGEILRSTRDLHQKELWTLSQHLKFPCLGRPQKLFNVQIALSALQGVSGITGYATHGTTAEDIVDGHRENTLSLLWSLVGKWGLETLIDRKEIEREIQRFRQRMHATQPMVQLDLDTDNESATAEPESLECYTVLLKSWARSIAHLHGHHVANLTTSFSNGQVLEAIVDEYRTCFPSSAKATIKGVSSSLGIKLRCIGCSNAFISLFVPASPSAIRPIPSKDFTLIALAFLASRLLPAHRTHRAATTIQMAYRMRLARREVGKRVVLMRLAKHCETVVKTRETVVGAAVVLQRAWRKVLDARIARLVSDVVGFQTLARGWAVRGKMGKRNGKRSERVRGGW